MIEGNTVELDANGPLMAMLREERAKALSTREWKFRLAGFGYAIKQVGGRQVITRLPYGTEIGVLPSELS